MIAFTVPDAGQSGSLPFVDGQNDFPALVRFAGEHSVSDSGIRKRKDIALVVAGLLNKQVGGELRISEITVKAHRGQVMRKMKAASFAELVRMAASLDLKAAAAQ